MKWRGRRALVTGGSRGIGRAIVEMLAREGVGIGLCARGEAGVQEAVAAALAHGAKAPQCGTIAPSVRPQCGPSAAADATPPGRLRALQHLPQKRTHGRLRA